MNYFKTIETHFYFGKDYFPVRSKTLEQIQEMMAQRNIEKNVMMSYMSIFGDFQKGNKELFEAIAEHDNLYGYCYINGNYLDESIKQMKTYLPLDKCRGIKFHPEYSAKRPNDKDLLPLFEQLCFKYEKPALIHSWPVGEHSNAQSFSHPNLIAALAELLPELKIIMGHMGGPSWQEAIDIAKPYPNLYLDTVSTYTDYDKVKAAVDALGAERVIFASGGAFDSQLGVIYDSEITEEEKKIVLYDAAERVFKF